MQVKGISQKAPLTGEEEQLLVKQHLKARSVFLSLHPPPPPPFLLWDNALCGGGVGGSFDSILAVVLPFMERTKER